jgi:hypothetical protein
MPINLLTDLEILAARSQGWMLAEVFDLKAKRLVHQVLPVTFKTPFDTARKASDFVIKRARAGDHVALKALQLVMQGLKQ